uniref:DUF4283 domain-containing protein n=1 Tax=Cannabis sativa TaxID=3483 RepID=A0A803NI85_CANSA
MESLIGDMSSKIVLSEKERAAHVLTETDLRASSTHSQFFLVARCDKLRLLEGEPWHYNNYLIVLHSPTVLHNVSKEDLNTVQIWVQVHRLPFLSKSRALACKVGEWIGEYIDVHEDSLHEGWGSFLRVRV